MDGHLGPVWATGGYKKRDRTVSKSGLAEKIRVTEGARTLDPWNHNPMLCQLSYGHRICILVGGLLGKVTNLFHFHNKFDLLLSADAFAPPLDQAAVAAFWDCIFA